MTHRATQLRRRNRRAFTFVELMISIALVIVLMLGVNQIFGYTSQAVGAGQAVNTAIRNSRSLGETMAGDFAQIVPNGNGPSDAACMVLHSGNVYAFRDAADYAASPHSTGNVATDAASIDLNNDGIPGQANVPGEQVSPTTSNFRNHRTDVFSFFARGQFQRQTGNDDTFVANMSSPEAWVWYGHVALPNNALDYSANPTDQFPGINAATASSAVNPNNFYASQFVLGRMAVLLQPKNANGQILDAQGQKQMFVDNTVGGAFSPLFRGSQTVNGGSSSTAGQVLTDSRVDLAATTIADFRANYNSYVAPYTQRAFGQNTGNTQGMLFNNNPLPSDFTHSAIGEAWWDDLVSGDVTVGASGGGGLTRFKCNPFVTKPMTAPVMAQASPYMLRGVSQFIVEYAGDYLTQDNNPNSITYGTVTSCFINPLLNVNPVSGVPTLGTGTDGEVDYVLVPPPNSAVNVARTSATLPGGLVVPSSQWPKQIRWYGFPRSTSNHSNIDPVNYGDVVPLAWHLKHELNLGLDVSQYADMTGSGPGCRQMSFEKTNLPYAANGDYASPTGVMVPGTAYQYTCAWGPNDPKPKLIRITVTLDDPTGRLADGQTYQYVYPVP